MVVIFVTYSLTSNGTEQQARSWRNSSLGILAGFYENSPGILCGAISCVTFDALTVAESRRNRRRRREHMTPTGARRTGCWNASRGQRAGEASATTVIRRPAML